MHEKLAARALTNLLAREPALGPIQPANYGAWSTPLAAVARAYAVGGAGQPPGPAAARACMALLDASAPPPLRLDLLLEGQAATLRRTRWTLRELAAAPALARDEFAGGLISSGLNLLCGRPFSGKSFLALKLALAVGAGSALAGGPSQPGRCSPPGETLYVALQDPVDRISRRLHQLAAADAAPMEFHFAFPALDGAGLDMLAGEMAQGPRLVVIDSFSAALGDDCRRDPQRILDLLSRLHVLAAVYDAALLLVDCHFCPPAEGRRDAIDEAFDAADDRSLFHQVITLTRPWGKGRARLDFGFGAEPVILDPFPGPLAELACDRAGKLAVAKGGKG